LSEITKKLSSKRVFKSYFVYFSIMIRVKQFIEWQVYGVCSAIGERMGIATTTIRKYFIYLSFATIGSPVLVYFFLAFWMNVKRYVMNARRNPLRHL
jgi:phage shock protein PspC (stress-responsive transcriptional regulator)